MTLTLRTNAYNDSLGECFSRHSLEHAQMTWALRPGTPRPLRLAIALIVGLMVFGVAHRTKAEESGHWTGPWNKDARVRRLFPSPRAALHAVTRGRPHHGVA